MARAETKPGWRTVKEVLPFSFDNNFRNSLLGANLPLSSIADIEDAVADFNAYALIVDEMPSLSEVKETLRQGEVAHRKGSEKFAAWLLQCDSKTRQLLQIETAILEGNHTGPFSINYSSFLEAARAVRDKQLSKRGRRKNNAHYELALRIAFTLRSAGMKVTSYDEERDPANERILQFGAQGGSTLFARIFRQSIKAGNRNTSDVSPYLEYAVSRLGN